MPCITCPVLLYNSGRECQSHYSNKMLIILGPDTRCSTPAGWCSQRLKQLGHQYGDMPAHSILWQGAQVGPYAVNCHESALLAVKQSAERVFDATGFS